MRLSLCVVLMILVAPTAAWASDHVASLYGAYSALLGSHHSGLQFGLEVSWPTTHKKIHDHVGILVDAAVHGGTDDARNRFTKAALLVGLRALYRTGDGKGRFVLFTHALIGGHRSQIDAEVDDGWAGGAGGGVDVLIGDTTNSGWGLRGQVDWVNVAGENSPRASIGAVFRFKE